MKLKKIASLALAGTMAVSMLAGCATKAPETGNNNTVTTTTSSVVSTVNGAQDVEFTDNAQLDEDLKKAVELTGDLGTAQSVADNFAKLSAIKAYLPKDLSGTRGPQLQASKDDAALVNSLGLLNKAATSANIDALLGKDYLMTDGEVFTYVAIGKVNALNETAAENMVATAVASLTSGLDETTYNKGVTKAGDKYMDYTYGGNVALTSVTDSLGVTYYYYAVVLTQTVAVETMPNK